MTLKQFRGRLFHLWFLLSRPMTLGVRIVVHDTKTNRVLLVRHTYVDGWHLPGGGVDAGETLVTAARREVFEETGLSVEHLSLVSAHFNTAASKRDHVMLYIARDFGGELGKPNREIAELGFFSPDDLPEATSAATRQRLKEVFAAAAPSDNWGV